MHVATDPSQTMFRRIAGAAPVVRAARAASSKSTEHFPGIGAIKYEGPKSTNYLAFKHYNPTEVCVACVHFFNNKKCLPVVCLF